MGQGGRGGRDRGTHRDRQKTNDRKRGGEAIFFISRAIPL